MLRSKQALEEPFDSHNKTVILRGMTKIHIEKIHLENFKGFSKKKIEGLDEGINVLIGDNDTGKSSILLAIDLVLGGNPSRVESIGLDKLINLDAVNSFLSKTGREFTDLPVLEVDLYISDKSKHELSGEHNLEKQNDSGFCLICRPKDDLRDDIEEIIGSEDIAFPYEFYEIAIKTFSGKTVSPYKKIIKHVGIDNTKISNDYASKAYTRQMYHANATSDERNKLRYQYRGTKRDFSSEQLKNVNEKMELDHSFALKNDSKANLENDLTIAQNGIEIENMGVGQQCFIRTKFALSKTSDVDIALIEEPENHLSHTNMSNLIEVIRSSSESQLFIATHSSMILSRLDLRHAIMLGTFDDEPIKLDALPEETAEFFIKAPSNAVLEFALSKRNILVEGDAEFILMADFYQRETGSKLNESSIHVISVNGTSFARYLDIASLLDLKTAAITDNDENYAANIANRYEEYLKHGNIEVFSDKEDANRTFEICLYGENSEICDELFQEGRRTLSVQDYMLSNKAEAAYQLSSKKGGDVEAPQYIKDAIQWIRS